MKIEYAAFSYSVNWTSIGRNSTRHPIGELGGGGLNLRVCQLVDWIFSKWSERDHLYNKQITGGISVLHNRLDVPSGHIPWWQLQQILPGSILVCDIPKQLKFDNVSNLNVYVVWREEIVSDLNMIATISTISVSRWDPSLAYLPLPLNGLKPSLPSSNKTVATNLHFHCFLLTASYQFCTGSIPRIWRRSPWQ